MSIRQSDSPRPESWPERTSIEDGEIRTVFRVRYAETDQMGMAYYANYLVWFEVMRGDFMRAIGLPYTQWEAEGYRLPIVEAHVRYRAPARYDDAIEVVAALREIASRRIRFDYRIEREGTILATGWTRHVPVGPEGRPRPLGPSLREALAPFVRPDPDPG